MEPPKEVPSPLDPRRVLASPGVPPKAANYFIYTVLGEVIQLDFAYLDLPEAREAIEKSKSSGTPERVQVYVTDRFTLTPSAALNLLMTVKELVETLRSFGKLPKVENAAD